jgi:hypothetical protein
LNRIRCRFLDSGLLEEKLRALTKYCHFNWYYFLLMDFKLLLIVVAAVLSWLGSHHLFCTALNLWRNYVLDKYEEESGENAWTSAGQSDRTVQSVIWLLFTLWLCICCRCIKIIFNTVFFTWRLFD